MSLASPDEPLRLADGTLVYADRVVTPQQQRKAMVEIPSNSEARDLVLNTRRKLADLPDIPRNLNAISVVLSYSLYGLDDEEISVALNISAQQVANIRAMPAYSKMYESVIESILEAEAGQVKDIFVQHTRKAARTFVDALDGVEVSGTQLHAANQILDRAGMRPTDVVEHRVRTENTLVIEVIKKDESKRAPVIDLEL